MSRPRKTLHLRELVDWVNERNATSTCDAKVREGWNAVVNSFLMAAEGYGGFSYLSSDELTGNAKGQPPGIVFDHTGECRHQFPDDTRIRFIITKGL